MLLRSGPGNLTVYVVTFMLDVSDHDVVDIGIDVPVLTFVQKTKEFGPRGVGLSGAKVAPAHISTSL